MLSLSLYSSSQSVSVSIYKNKEKLLFLEKKNQDVKKSDELILLIQKALKKEPFNSITHIYFSRGPGGFTAIRALISISQGLAIAGKAKIRTVTIFEALISCFKKKITGNILVLFKDARKDYYFQFFKFKKGLWIKDSNIFCGNIKKIELKIKNYCDTKTEHKINIISDKFDFEFDCLSNKRLIELEINADSISQAIICGYGKNIIRPVYHQQHYGKKN